jgi:hypothetical protein
MGTSFHSVFYGRISNTGSQMRKDVMVNYDKKLSFELAPPDDKKMGNRKRPR